MRKLFRERISKFGSLISLIMLIVMLTLFSMSLPEFLVSNGGRVFAVIWALTAILIFIAHAKRMSVTRRHYMPAVMSMSGKKDARFRKPIRSGRVMRG